MLTKLKHRLVNFERSVWLQRKLHTLRYLSQPKIKLVAIARNEAAYLAEWVHHHLYFGFAEIEVHYNNCTDNTQELAACLASSRVHFCNADHYFQQNDAGAPQVEVYRNAFIKAREQGFSHVMFLDIDEFWLPADLKTSISQWARSRANSDIVCFNWLNKIDESEPFSRVLDTPMLAVEPAEQVKSMYKSFVWPGQMNAHNIIDNSLRYCRDDGTDFFPLNKHFSRLKKPALSHSKDRAFIIHRKYRSEKEYIAMLGRGRPIGKKLQKSIFKNNRNGYINAVQPSMLDFSQEVWEKYTEAVTRFMNQPDIAVATEQGHQFIEKAYTEALNMIEMAPKGEMKLLAQLLRNVKDAKTVKAYSTFLGHHNIKNS